MPGSVLGLSTTLRPGLAQAPVLRRPSSHSLPNRLRVCKAKGGAHPESRSPSLDHVLGTWDSRIPSLNPESASVGPSSTGPSSRRLNYLWDVRSKGQGEATIAVGERMQRAWV